MSGPISIGDLKTTFADLFQNQGNSLSDYYGITFSVGSAPASGTISLGDFLGKTPGSASVPPYTIEIANDITLTDSNPKYFTFQRQDSSAEPIIETVHAPTSQYTEEAEFTTALGWGSTGNFLLNTISTPGDSIKINPDNPPDNGTVVYVLIFTPGPREPPEHTTWVYTTMLVSVTYSP